MFEELVFGRCVVCPHHGEDRCPEGDAKEEHRGACHEAVADAGVVRHFGTEPDDAEACASVEEGFMEVGALEGGEGAVGAGFAVEEEVDCEEGAAEEGTGFEEAAGGGLRVGAGVGDGGFGDEGAFLEGV